MEDFANDNEIDFNSEVQTIETENDDNISEVQTIETENDDNTLEVQAVESENGDNISEVQAVESENDDNISEVQTIESENSDNTLEVQTVESENSENVIYVDEDFQGDLKAAIASANDGDTVILGSYKTYYTSGINIDKDITIDGQEGSIIDGSGTVGSILNLTPGASGTTIQDVEITNGNNGIFGNGASDVTLENLEVNNIGIDRTDRYGENNTGINFNLADGLQIYNTTVRNIGKKGVGVGDTDGFTLSGLTVENINLAAQHSQSHDAAGVKFYNTNNAVIADSYFSSINAINIWNDTTNGTTIKGNNAENVGEDFLAPSFNDNVGIRGIYNEKSSNSIVEDNSITSLEGFSSLDATQFSTETMTLGNNDFSSYELGTIDYWVNENVEKLIAITEDPQEANFDLFAEEYLSQANIG